MGAQRIDRLLQVKIKQLPEDLLRLAHLALEAWVDDQHYKVVDQDEAARKLLHKHDNLIRQLIEYSEVLANAVDTALGKPLESDA
ncbi:hypothetical protein QQ73_07830 [Candidatus Endoriftia persephone str. Guaymas]|nr:hypothetical protein [Candidatus Endoriftia persephone str. Guaymas]